MKIGIISDAHGNKIGLSACLDFLTTSEKIDRIFFLGDAVGYFPDADGVVELLQKNNVSCLLGNHDAMLLGQLPIDPEKNSIYQLNETNKNCSPATRNFLSKLNPQQEIILEGKKILLTHGNPLDPLEGYIYENSDLEKIIEMDHDIFIMGHTHRAFIKHISNKIIINAGSCGLPRDIGNMASFAVLDITNNIYTIKRIKMDIDKILMTYPKIHPAVVNCLKR